MNGWGTGLDSGVENDWLCFPALLSFIILLITTNAWGGFDLSISPTFRVGRYDVYLNGNNIDVMERGSMGLVKIIINFLKCLFVFPILGIIYLIKGEYCDNPNIAAGYKCYTVSLLLLILPLTVHLIRIHNCDSRKFEYELLDVYYTEGDSRNWTHIDLKVTHPSKHVSSIEGKLHFYIDGKHARSLSYEYIQNEVTTGLLTMKPGENEDFSEVSFTVSIQQRNIDLVGLFTEKSDRLMIVHELTNSTFKRGRVSAESVYYKKLPKVSLYPSAK